MSKTTNMEESHEIRFDKGYHQHFSELVIAQDFRLSSHRVIMEMHGCTYWVIASILEMYPTSILCMMS